MESKDGMTPQGGASANNINGGPSATNTDLGAATTPGDATATSSGAAVATPAGMMNATPSATATPQVSAPAAPGVAATPQTPAPSPAPAAPNTPATPQSPAPTAPGTPAAAGQTPDKPKKKTGLIVGIACGVAALVAVVIVGVVVAINLNADPVKAALTKIMTNGLPTYAKIDGSMNFEPAVSDANASESGGVSCNVGVNGEIELATLKNAMNLSLACESEDDSDAMSSFLGNLDVNVEERNVDDTLYIKVEGIKGLFSGALSGSTMDDLDETEAYEDEELEDEEYMNDLDIPGDTYSTQITNGISGSTIVGGSSGSSTSLDGSMMMLGILGMFGGIFDEIDGQWIAVSDAQVDQGMESNCTVKFFMNIKNQGKQFADVYNTNPFIVSSTENVSIKSKNSTVYQLTIDREKYASFINTADNAGLLNEYRTCLKDNNETDMINDFPKMLEETYKPTAYVEVNDDKDFSRLYFTMTNEEQGTYKIDLGLSYPSSIQVEAPEDATDFQTLLQSAMSGMFGGMTYQTTDYNSSIDDDYGIEYNYDDYDYEYDY